MGAAGPRRQNERLPINPSFNPLDGEWARPGDTVRVIGAFLRGFQSPRRGRGAAGRIRDVSSTACKTCFNPLDGEWARPGAEAYRRSHTRRFDCFNPLDGEWARPGRKRSCELYKIRLRFNPLDGEWARPGRNPSDGPDKTRGSFQSPRRGMGAAGQHPRNLLGVRRVEARKSPFLPHGGISILPWHAERGEKP